MSINSSKMQCCGCKACENVCPRKCICIDYLNGSFVKRIDKKKCSSCDACNRVCPMSSRFDLKVPVIGYSAAAKSKQVCKKSSSGGIATLLYYLFLNHNDICIGVRYDEKMRAIYDVIRDINDLDLYVGSKYVYSDMNSVYSLVDRYLKEGKRVLFIGLPCHIVGLRNSIREIYQKNLYAVDLVCSGEPRFDIFKRYVGKIESKTCRKVRKVAFRNKNNSYGVTAYGANDEIIYKKKWYEDPYMVAYRYEMSLCLSCYGCRFAQERRAGDMTIKDGFFSKKFPYKRIRVPYNASFVMINSEKGKELWEKIVSTNEIWYEECNVDSIVDSDKRLNKAAKNSFKRKIFDCFEKAFGVEMAVKVLFPIEEQLYYTRYLKK